MSLALSGKGLLFSILFVGLASQETGLIKELDHNYSLAKSTDDLYTLEALVKKSLKTFPESDKLFWRLGRVYFKLGETFTSESKKFIFFRYAWHRQKKRLKLIHSPPMDIFLTAFAAELWVRLKVSGVVWEPLHRLKKIWKLPLI